MSGRKPAVFLGSKALGLAVFDALSAHAPDLAWTVLHPADGDDPRSVAAAFAARATALGAGFETIATAGAARARLQATAAQIGFVCGWYWLIDAEALSAIPGGLWGVHNSLLPKYRGGAPLVWSILSGEEEVGASVFRISPGMDDGPLLHQIRVANAPDDDIASLLGKIEAQLVDELPCRWRALLDGRAELTAQDESQASYCGQRIADDGRIDWRQNAAVVHDFIRAQTWPYPGAFSFLGPDRVTILKSKLCAERWRGVPGQVLRRTQAGALVACGAGAIEITRLAVNGVEAPVSAVLTSVKQRLASAPEAV